MSNIYLTGMMGSGKSVTGQHLAELLKYTFLDLDDRIEQRCGMSIASIFESKGEAFFRRHEKEVLRETAGHEPQVVATGGGVVLDPENVAVMKANGKIVYLETSFDQLVQRLQGQKNRPLLKNGVLEDRLREIFESRRRSYETHCDFKVMTDGRSADEVAREIVKMLRRYDKESL